MYRLKEDHMDEFEIKKVVSYVTFIVVTVKKRQRLLLTR